MLLLDYEDFPMQATAVKLITA